jgi:predicted nuclease of predicted toxin-antitoxin system
VLLDTCVWGGVRERLIEQGHDVVWCGDWTEDPGDDEILALALSQSRVLVTLDKDFGELAIVQGRPHAGIVRLVAMNSDEQVRVCVHVLERYARELAAHAIVTASGHRVRIRPASDPISDSSSGEVED